jgi:hypothetical protein
MVDLRSEIINFRYATMFACVGFFATLLANVLYFVELHLNSGFDSPFKYAVMMMSIAVCYALQSEVFRTVKPEFEEKHRVWLRLGSFVSIMLAVCTIVIAFTNLFSGGSIHVTDILDFKGHVILAFGAIATAQATIQCRLKHPVTPRYNNDDHEEEAK